MSLSCDQWSLGRKPEARVWRDGFSARLFGLVEPFASTFLAGSAADAIANVRRQRRVDHLHWFETGIEDAVEERLPGAEQDGGEVEYEFVDHPCGERLAHRGCAAGNVDSSVTRDLRRTREGGVEAFGDEMERRPALHRDWLVRVVGENEHRSVIGRLVAPPSAPFVLPGAANRPEHVAPHHVRATRTHEQVARPGVGLVQRLVEIQ